MDVLQYSAHTGLFLLDIFRSSVFLWAVVLTVIGTSPRTCVSLPVPESTSYPLMTTPPRLLELETEQKQVYIEDEGCQITVWDTTRQHRGVHQVNGRCKEGLISWRSPYGAVRLTLGVGGHHSNGVEACFLAKSNFTTAKISLEKDSATTDDKDSSTPLETLVTLNTDNPEIENEICVRSSHDAVTLYIEADHDLNSYTIGLVDIEYSVDTLEKSSPSSQDPEEDCRPCTEKELLTAVCTKDFVVSGRMESVENSEKSLDSVIHIAVDNVYRQIENHFTQKSDESTELHNHSFHWQDSNSNVVKRKYTDTIMVPKKCGARRGDGLFLFLGKLRLGKAILQCAPRLEEFTKMWHRALNRKTNPCTMKWNL